MQIDIKNEIDIQFCKNFRVIAAAAASTAAVEEVVVVDDNFVIALFVTFLLEDGGRMLFKIYIYI